MSSHTVDQAKENIEVIKSELIKFLPGGEKNIKSIYLKTTNAPAVPLYIDTQTDLNQIKLKNNMTEKKIKKAKKFAVKRLKRKLAKKV